MLTITKLKIFEKYGGSLGSYEYAKQKHLNILPYGEFSLIERLVQDLKMVERGLVAKSYEEQLENNIKENCESADAIKYLKNLSIGT